MMYRAGFSMAVSSRGIIDPEVTTLWVSFHDFVKSQTRPYGNHYKGLAILYLRQLDGPIPCSRFSQGSPHIVNSDK